jgi:hypothetical protein
VIASSQSGSLIAVPSSCVTSSSQKQAVRSFEILGLSRFLSDDSSRSNFSTDQSVVYDTALLPVPSQGSIAEDAIGRMFASINPHSCGVKAPRAARPASDLGRLRTGAHREPHANAARPRPFISRLW